MGTENGHSASMEQAVRAQWAVEGGQWGAARQTSLQRCAGHMEGEWQMLAGEGVYGPGIKTERT